MEVFVFHIVDFCSLRQFYNRLIDIIVCQSLSGYTFKNWILYALCKLVTLEICDQSQNAKKEKQTKGVNEEGQSHWIQSKLTIIICRKKTTFLTRIFLNEEWHRTASRILFYRKDNFFTDHFAVRLILCCKKSLHWQGFPAVRLTFCSRSTIIPCCQLSFSPVFLLFPAFPFLMFFLTALFLFSSLFSSFSSFSLSQFFHSFSEQYYILLVTIICIIFNKILYTRFWYFSQYQYHRYVKQCSNISTFMAL